MIRGIAHPPSAYCVAGPVEHAQYHVERPCGYQEERDQQPPVCKLPREQKGDGECDQQVAYGQALQPASHCRTAQGLATPHMLWQWWLKPFPGFPGTSSTRRAAYCMPKSLCRISDVALSINEF